MLFLRIVSAVDYSYSNILVRRKQSLLVTSLETSVRAGEIPVALHWLRGAFFRQHFS